MRLLNVYTFKLSEFEGKNVPRYAVASHRWCENEATYVDVVEGKNKDSEGYKKIVGFCEFVKWRNDISSRSHSEQNIEWIWVDTCCIDRRSSADIGENITSMYKYYEQSVECYAYLQDVPGSNGDVDLDVFAASNWFTRGWTLQELLAPSRVFFLSSTWQVFGHKCSARHRGHHRSSQRCGDRLCSWTGPLLNDAITRATGIDVQVLEKRLAQKKWPVDQICKWIEKRETKKEEDLAYCLTGLLGVFVVPNYGEGENAWSRLEDEANKKRKKNGQPEVSLTRPAQLRPDEERYEPSIFTEPMSRPLSPSLPELRDPSAFPGIISMSPWTPDSEHEGYLRPSDYMLDLGTEGRSREREPDRVVTRRRRPSYHLSGRASYDQLRRPDTTPLRPSLSIRGRIPSSDQLRNERLEMERRERDDLERRRRQREEEAVRMKFEDDKAQERKAEFEMLRKRMLKEAWEAEQKDKADAEMVGTHKEKQELEKKKMEEEKRNTIDGYELAQKLQKHEDMKREIFNNHKWMEEHGFSETQIQQEMRRLERKWQDEDSTGHVHGRHRSTSPRRRHRVVVHQTPSPRPLVHFQRDTEDIGQHRPSRRRQNSVSSNGATAGDSSGDEVEQWLNHVHTVDMDRKSHSSPIDRPSRKNPTFIIEIRPDGTAKTTETRTHSRRHLDDAERERNEVVLVA